MISLEIEQSSNRSRKNSNNSLTEKKVQNLKKFLKKKTMKFMYEI